MIDQKQMHRLTAVGVLALVFLLAAVPATTTPIMPPTTAPTSAPTTRHSAATTSATQMPPGFDMRNAPSSPFELSTAATQAESVSTLLHSMESDIRSDRETPAIQAQLPVLTQEINARLDESARLLAASPSLQLLANLEQDWTSIHENLQSWDETVQRRNDRIQAQTKLTDQYRRDWTSAKNRAKYISQNPRARDVMDDVLATVDPTLDHIAATDEALKEHAHTLYKLQGAVDSQNAHVMEALESVKESRADAFDRLLERNDTPVWSLWNSKGTDRSVIQQGQDSVEKQLQAVWAYIQRRWENVAAQFALFFALAINIRFARTRLRNWVKDDPGFQRAEIVFSLPATIAVVIALLLSPWFYPQAPRLFWAIVGAAALIPTVVMLRRLIDPRLFPILNALVVFYFIDQIRLVAAAVPLLARLLFLLEMLGVMLLLGSFVNSTRQQATGDRVWKAIRFFGWLSLLTCAVSFAGDVLGYVSLANLLGDAVLQSQYLAVTLYACVSIAIGLLVIALRTRPLLFLGMVRRHRDLLLRRLTLLIQWAAAITWLIGLLSALSIRTVVYETAYRILTTDIGAAGLDFSLGHLIKFGLVVWASFILSRFLRFVLEEDVYGRFPMAGGLSYAISKMLNYVVLLFGFFIAVHALGYNLTQFTILAGAFGVGLGFGMQNIVNNFVSGLILLFERPVKVGDVIQMDDITGIVGHIGIRASIVKTSDSSEIIIPNGNLISSKVTNWTLSSRQRGISIPVTVAATADPRHVMDLLTRVAAAHPRIVKYPPPQAFLTTFGGDGFHYELHSWTEDAEHWILIRSDLSIALNAALVQENIPIK